jgi:exodeoxyribonuclease VII large subunit
MQNTKKVYTVSQVNLLIKIALEESLPPRLTVSGEIRDFKIHTSGHCYFALKDENGILPCVMWSSKFKGTKFSPEDGAAVLATGHIDVYTVGGKYQFYVDKLEPAGVGALQVAFERMVKKLRDEGLFDEAHKRRLPVYPERIGIITSESGAALHDITDSIRSRWPCVKLYLYPVPVQGEGAAEEIAAALRDINRRQRQLKLDVLIVGRGGGSLEDLWAFNEEVVARAIFASRIPVISAVGHEVDTTIADLVADARASTPTKAGVVAVPDRQDVLIQLMNAERRLAGQSRAIIRLSAQNLKTVLASAVFRNPMLPVQMAQQHLDELHTQMNEAIQELLRQATKKVLAYHERVIRIEPHRFLGKMAVELNNLKNGMAGAVENMMNRRLLNLTAVENRLVGLNPKSVLKRGYSITTNKRTGLLVRQVEDVRLEDVLTTELSDENIIESKVTKKIKEERSQDVLKE